MTRSPSRGSTSLAAAVVAALAGCEPGAPPEAGTASRDSADVVIVESESPAWDDGEAWSVAADPSVSIGVVDGEAAYQLDRVRAVASAPDGRIVVANAGSSEIRVYDSAGQHLVSFGGTGEGPGEFRRVGSMVLLGDTVAVFDEAAQRLTTFDLSGALIGTTTFEPTGDPIHPLRMYAIGGAVPGGLAMLARAFPADMRPEPVTYWDTLPTLRYSRTGRWSTRSASSRAWTRIPRRGARERSPSGASARPECTTGSST